MPPRKIAGNKAKSESNPCAINLPSSSFFFARAYEPREGKGMYDNDEKESSRSLSCYSRSVSWVRVGSGGSISRLRSSTLFFCLSPRSSSSMHCFVFLHTTKKDRRKKSRAPCKTGEISSFPFVRLSTAKTAPTKKRRAQSVMSFQTW